MEPPARTTRAKAGNPHAREVALRLAERELRRATHFAKYFVARLWPLVEIRFPPTSFLDRQLKLLRRVA
jgi:hypothetical protein